MSNYFIDILGLTQQMKDEAELTDNMYVGRISSQHKNLYSVLYENVELTGEISGKLRHEINNSCDYPSVGDFVLIDRQDNLQGNVIISKVLKRKSVFIRKSAGKTEEEQVVAANIDKVFICMALNEDYNLRRLERYIAIAWDSGAVPVIILTKSDICNNVEAKIYEINQIAIGVDIIAVSYKNEDSMSEIKEFIHKGETAVFLGSSGVGKSTIINNLMGENFLDTREIRRDGKGRHTTTFRQLIILPEGRMVIDTPGMRELGIISADIKKTFADINEISFKCRYDNCTHTKEPGCEVLKAVEDGVLPIERLENYRKLKKEAKYEGLNSRQIEKEKTNEMFKDFGGIKNAKKHIKQKNKGMN